MSEQDWRALLKAIIDDGTPIIEYGIDHIVECQYCYVGEKAEHKSDCMWRMAEEALGDA